MKGLFNNKKAKRLTTKQAHEEKPWVSKAKMLLALTVCMVVSYTVATIWIGNGAYTYSDTLYDNLETVTRAAFDAPIATTEQGEQEEEKQADEVAEDTAKKTTTVDIEILNEGTDYYEISKEGDYTVVKCYIKNGFFKAETTFYISGREIMEIDKNFESQQDYIVKYQVLFGVCVIGGGVLIYLLGVGATAGLAFAINCWDSHKEKQKEAKEKKAVAV